METQMLTVCWILLASVGSNANKEYVHLGCYKDNTESSELVHQYTTSADDDTSRCLATCQHQGFPFAGIQSGGENCSCGNTTGRDEQSDNCVYDCYEDGFPECGGDTDYSIYYTLTKADTCPAKSMNVHRSPSDICLTFTAGVEFNFMEARKKCIESGSDLAAVTGESTHAGLKALLDKESVGNIVLWIGLNKDTENETFKWSSALDAPYNHSVYKNKFSADLTESELCVALNMNTALWETHACDETLPFVCMTTLSYSSIHEKKNAFLKFLDPLFEFYSNDNNLATYLVLPFFLLLMVSCCLPYCLHRLKENRNQATVKVKENNQLVAEVTAKYMMDSYYFGTSNTKQPFCLY